jgi:hypothetical protein
VTTRDRARQRVCLAWIARAVLAVAVIGGLFAMHGLPAMGSGGMSHAGPSSGQSMASNDMAQVSLDGPKTGAEVSAVLPASLVRTTEVAVGCGMDHTNCVAVLRAEQHLAPVMLGAVPASSPGHAAPMGNRLARCESRAPPDISLTRLCISRT